MEKLHSDIVESILRRLPIETALQAQWVCKTWRSFLRSKINEEGLLFSFSYYDYIEDEIKLSYGDQPDPISGKMNYGYSFDKVEKIQDDKSIKGHKYMDNMLGSCNGFVCFQSKYYYHEKPYLIINPITGEVVYVPEPDKSIAREFGPTKISGFGYCQSTNEYKIVQMYSDYEEQKKYRHHVLVYTIGSGEWRHRGSIDISPFKQTGIYANSALHWLHEEYTTLAFDLEDEKFQCIPLPVGFKDVIYKHRPTLLGGNNLYCHTSSDEPYCTDIWEYKRKKTNTTVTTNGCDMKENYNEKNSWHWIKQFSINWEEPSWKDLWFFEPITITRNDELLLRNSMTFYCYDLKTSTLKLLFDGFSMGCDRVNIIPHANSIVSMSLKEGIKDGL